MTDEEVRLYGYGVYEGDQRPEELVHEFDEEQYSKDFDAKAPACFYDIIEKEDRDVFKRVSMKLAKHETDNFTNPRIRLDNGKIVWGMMCWWGPEDKIKKSIEGKKVIEVPVPEMKNTL